jgi:hypothetical protein
MESKSVTEPTELRDKDLKVNTAAMASSIKHAKSAIDEMMSLSEDQQIISRSDLLTDSLPGKSTLHI